MRNSPINHLRHTRQYAESPYQNIPQNRSGNRDALSPDRVIHNSDAEYWRQRAKSLQAQMLAANEELMFQARKIQKIQELEDKIEVLLAQNSHLVDENQNLIKLIQQKKSQIDIWKSRFQGQYTQSNIAQAEKKKIFDHLNIKDQQHQIQIDKLLSEISRLHDQMEQMETLKAIQINGIKNKYENEAMNQIQNLKRSQYGNNQLQELNNRKLKDMIEEKTFQIENLRRETKLQNERLNAQIAYLKNDIKKIEHQKQHEIDLIKTQNQNTKNNLIRANRKSQQQMKNIHQTKIKRLNYEVQEKKHQIQEFQSKLKKGGKENQVELNQITNQKSKLRQQIRQNQNANRQRINLLTQFYQKQMLDTRNNFNEKQINLKKFYENQINSLKQIIDAKQDQIKRLLKLNSSQRSNQQNRLDEIKRNNDQLKNKIEELILHYERQIQLMKIKISQLYQNDLESLRSNMKQSYAAHQREADNLRQTLQNTRDRLAKQSADRLSLRKQYENRLNEFKIKYERQHQQLQDLLAQHQSQLKNQTSKASLTHIQHNQQLQRQTKDFRTLINQKNQLDKQIKNKNKQIQQLNLRIQKMQGFHKRQITKLQQQISKLKDDHNKWLDNQDKQNLQWNKQRSQFKQNIHLLNKKLQQSQNNKRILQDSLQRQIQKKNLKIAQLEGLNQMLRSKVGVLDSQNKVQVQNIQKTHLQTQSLMNSQKEKLLEAKDKQIRLKQQQYKKRISNLENDIAGLKNQNSILRDNNENAKIREVQLGLQIKNLLDTVNKRNKLQQHVINIGMSNNYFKNVAQIFKKVIT